MRPARWTAPSAPEPASSKLARGPAATILDIAIRPDGRIVAVGNTGEDGLVARLPAAGGSLDPTFGGG